MKMNLILVWMFLPLLMPMVLEVIIINSVTARLNSVQVISYKYVRKTKNIPPMCALDKANETMSSSSKQDCSLECGRNSTCAGFNIKNTTICDLYNYKPKLIAILSDCTFLQVAIFSNFWHHFYARELA